MKSKFIIGALAIGLFATTAMAQSNNTAGAVQPNLMPTLGVSPTISGGLQQVWDATTGSTNYAIAFSGGRSLHGNYNLIAVDYLYNFNQNAGLLLGFDDIAKGSKFTSDGIAFVKGGINLQAQIAPLKNFGLPKFYVTPFGALLMSTHNGEVGQIMVAGVNYDLGIGKGWAFNLGGYYENRSGTHSDTDKPFACVHLAVSRGF